MCRQAIVIYAADCPGLRRAYERAMARNVERVDKVLDKLRPHS